MYSVYIYDVKFILQKRDCYMRYIIPTATSNSSQTFRQVSIAAGVVPQSSCNFNPAAPALICSLNARGSDAFPLPVKAKFIGISSVAVSIISMCDFPGVQVVAFVPV